MMAYVTRYIFGTDKLRPYAFEVRGLNGASTGVVHCDDAAILSQWLKYITDNIMGLTHLQVRHLVDYVLIIFTGDFCFSRSYCRKDSNRGLSRLFSYFLF